MKREMILGFFLSTMAAMGCGTGGSKAPERVVITESEGIFSYKVGELQVYMLVEAQRQGNADILVGADKEILQHYIPSAGFMHSTNAFLIKTPGQTILVDTAFGGPIYEKMQKLGVEPNQVDIVLITHLHGDHFGGLQKDGKALLPKAKIYLSAKELEYFTKTQVNEGAVAALAPYGANVITFEPANLDEMLTEVAPGISPIANYGHTPGHTAYLVENGKDQLLIAGDFLHIALVQFAFPDISASYDMDKEAAAASRKQILDFAANNNIPIGGMHIVYPGIGTVAADGEGFKFTPAR